MGFLSYILTDDQLVHLLELFPPRYPSVLAHHITIDFNCPAEPDPVLIADNVTIIGVADNDIGIQSLIVTIDGQTLRDSDGFPYHITWSIDPSKVAPAELDINSDPNLQIAQPYRANHSNRLISIGKWTTVLDKPIQLGSMTATYEE